ncbi:hypothetical protein B0T11DRAFT_287655 [Plectosphaerella cucumerina]|uniref:Uncharacterized protein n=1 Tax=Plectosphaerella cucumerina TaxID=40658 RepID=A0A8K0T8C0_9PEZI|nr:hypothetical protein B0T11DRAFT_287655 [Plectosphaerella cucumerina]
MSTRCACSTASKLSLATAARPSLTFTRTFASSRRETIPPESPRYVQVPEPRQGQRSEIVPKRIPGSLPPPRQIFSGSRKDHKLRDDYMDLTAAEPSNEDSKRPVLVDSPTDIKRRMADARRRNLVEGLSGLLDRKQTHDAKLKAHSDQHARNALRMRNAVERPDDRLTRSTILESTRRQVSVLPDPERFNRAAESKLRTAEFYKAKSEKRRDALMALYATATDFIVDEAHFSREVERIFQDEYFKKQSHSLSPDADNAWDVWGPPTTLASLANAGARSGTANEWDHSDSERSVRRQKSIAEDLTGGKMISGNKTE